ncbi:MAG: 50S ribosomal protein L23 [Candidatus Microsaccharimonas sossegonensis]|uniref:Large ribosomal subunit protein uL23 n=1 Tax=Candidatus Microsaccharimonas sossegonensis TaxID=2506948 RepID=A0A4Q0AIG3_9BACT|nr:MAG: 50S ribosomal protein L23 [Candidatus Microsaccharimonas sossegonensis]
MKTITTAPIFVTPVTTEKAYGQSQKNIYVFNVPLTANKQQIKNAVQSQYDVTIVTIKTLVQSGKAIRFSRGKNRYPGSTSRTDSKKAYVTLADGSSLNIFGVEETDKKATEEKK